eukprot:jgi/Mesen1/4551/ME000232S03804
MGILRCTSDSARILRTKSTCLASNPSQVVSAAKPLLGRSFSNFVARLRTSGEATPQHDSFIRATSLRYHDKGVRHSGGCFPSASQSPPTSSVSGGTKNGTCAFSQQHERRYHASKHLISRLHTQAEAQEPWAYGGAHRQGETPVHEDAAQVAAAEQSRGAEAAHALESARLAALDVADAQAVFAKLTTRELANALLNLELAASEALVDLGTWVVRSPLMRSRLLAAPLVWGVRRTSYAHFCAGETVEEAVSYACVKLTALAPLPLLERLAGLLRWQHSQPEQQKQAAAAAAWMQPSLPVLAPSSPPWRASGALPITAGCAFRYAQPQQQQQLAAPEPLSDSELQALQRCRARLKAVCDACAAHGVPLLIDAEYQSVQPAIDHLAFEAMRAYNVGRDLPLVYFTVQVRTVTELAEDIDNSIFAAQCYLKDSFDRLQLALAAARSQGLPFGVKLVRGAYLTREAAHAASVGLPSPVHGSVAETHACYDKCAALMIHEAAAPGSSSAKGSAAVVIATHNYASAITDWGGAAHRYLPYGPVMDVMPYLLRRAEENRGVLGNTAIDRSRINGAGSLC